MIKTTFFRAWILVIASGGLWAAVDTYQFNNQDLRERFQTLNEELRCPKCQNQNLTDSNAPIATDLRAEVYRLLNEGKSDREIKNYLVERYGEYVLYRPEWSGQTYLLWLAPAAFVLIGISLVVLLIRRTRKNRQISTPMLSQEEQDKLKRLLETSEKIIERDQ